MTSEHGTSPGFHIPSILFANIKNVLYICIYFFSQKVITMKNKTMFIAIVIITLILTLSSLVTLGTIPSKFFIDNDSLIIKSKLNINLAEIPLSEIEIKEKPRNITSSLIRTCGTTIGKYNSGKFYNKELDLNFYIYTTGKRPTIYFEYKSQKYLVDNWR